MSKRRDCRTPSTCWETSEAPDAIKRSLKKAQEAARERPVAELVEECREIVDRSTKRMELDAETVLLQESRVRLARLDAQQAATPATRGAQVVNLQQMVHQLQTERDALCLELRQSRVDRTSWSGDARPDVSSIPLLPDDHQAIEERMNSRNRELRT